MLWGTGIGQFFFSILNQHSVNKVHTLRYSVSKISEYKSRCCVFLLFCYILCRKSWYLVQCRFAVSTYIVYQSEMYLFPILTCEFFRHEFGYQKKYQVRYQPEGRSPIVTQRLIPFLNQQLMTC